MVDKDHPIFVYVNKPRIGPFFEDKVTGAQIKERAGLALDGELSRVEGERLIPVGNDETIRIHEDEHFRYIPPTPGSR